MRIKSLCMVFLCTTLLFLNGFPRTIETMSNSAKTSKQIQRLKIIKSKTTLRRGETGIIVIQGTPGVEYTLKTTYEKRGRVIPVTQWRTADNNGEAIFNWVVDDETEAKTHSIVISGNGEVIETQHTVLP